MGGAWRSLVARVLWELPIIQTKSIANTDKKLIITFQKVRVSENFFSDTGVKTSLDFLFITSRLIFPNRRITIYIP